MNVNFKKNQKYSWPFGFGLWVASLQIKDLLHYETGCVFNQKAQFYKILLDTAKVVTAKMHNSSQSSLSILISAFILVFEVWMVVKEFSDLCMATLDELIIGISQGFAFHLKIITQMV